MTERSAKIQALLDKALRLLPYQCDICYHPATYLFRVNISGSGNVPRDSKYCDVHCPARFRRKEYELEQAQLVRDYTNLGEE